MTRLILAVSFLLTLSACGSTPTSNAVRQKPISYMVECKPIAPPTTPLTEEKILINHVEAMEALAKACNDKAALIQFINAIDR